MQWRRTSRRVGRHRKHGSRAPGADLTVAQPPPRRALTLNLGLLRYGTDDRTQGAAVMFTLLLFGAMIVLMLVGLFQPGQPWTERAFTLIEKAIYVIVGVAIGKSGS